ncbi:hypothetical protein BE17_10120 [Sorangium cellulosum]|uniref:Uncharacterized protein n=1 Tax=Sorangium cellulosum TaxID=56 RepID=A0A150RXJ8_SORCE|nr:hypothetical protein BE17_10120 [Sorangium cellulosum]
MSTEASAQRPRDPEILVRIAPFCASGRTAARATGGRVSRYHAWVYTKLALSTLALGDLGAAGSSGAPPTEIGGLPLVGHEELSITWLGYAEYLSIFYGGEGALLELRHRIGRSMSRGLRAILRLRPRAPQRLRIWWSTETPELEDLPWEILFLGARRPPCLSLVRGSPGRVVPPLALPQEQPLRVAVVDPTGGAPAALVEALHDLGPGVEVIWIEEDDPRRALSAAVGAGVEVLHVVADGVVPLGLEGLLEFSQDEEDTLSALEVAAMLRGSSVTILSLTPPEIPRVGHGGMPTVYHAFARFGHDSGGGPSIVAQLSPMHPRVVREFWRAFYPRLAAALDVEDAMMSASQRPLVTPVVLFLRHRLSRQFAREGEETRRSPSWPTLGTGQTPAEGVPLTPAQVTADLSCSRSLLDAARALEARYTSLGLEFPGKGLIERETRRQADLDEAIDRSLPEDTEP